MVPNNERALTIQHRLYTIARDNAWLIASLLLAIVVALWVQWPHISDPYTVQDDFRKFFWMHRYEDPHLFPDDPKIQNTVKHFDLGILEIDLDITSPLYSAIFFLASPFFSINLINKLLVFPLILISVYVLYKIGASRGSPGTGFALAAAFAVLNLSSPDTISVVSGLQRSFVAPILLVIVYSLMQERYWIAAIALAVGGLIYPPIMLLGLLVYLPSLFTLKLKPFRFKIHWRRTYPLLALAILAIVFLIPAFSAQIKRIDLEAIVAFDGLQRLLDTPYYQPNGRYPLFDPMLGLLVGRAGFFTRIEMLWWSVILAFLSLAFVVLRPASWREFPGPLKHLLWAGFIGYGLAWLAVIPTGSFILYLPNRYSRVSLFLAFLAFLVMSSESVIPTALYRLKQLNNRTAWLPILATIATCATVLWLIQNDISAYLSTTKAVNLTWNVALATGILAGAFVLRALGWGIPADQLRSAGKPKIKQWHWLVLGVFALVSSWSYISQTEIKDKYLATDDTTKNVISFLESLPVDSRVMGEPCAMNSIAFLSKRSVLFSCKQPYGGAVVKNDTLNAYYGESLIKVFQFCQRYDVDYLLVNSELFTEGDQYALLEVPDESRIFQDDGQFVMSCRPSSGESGIPVELAQMEEAKLAWSAIDPELVQQGSNVDIHLYWEDLNTGTEIPQLCLSLISQAGDATKPKCRPLSSAKDIRQLGEDTWAFMTYQLRVSPYLNAGKYEILAEVISSNEGSGESISGVIGEIHLSAHPRTFASEEEQEAGAPIASWGDQIALTNVTISSVENRLLEIGLSWQALARMSGSNKVFVHLAAANGAEPLAQVDAVPRNWTYPTNWWEKGEIITDTLSIPIDGVSRGSYQLWLGLYDEETLERLPLDDFMSSDDPRYKDAIKIADLDL